MLAVVPFHCDLVSDLQTWKDMFAVVTEVRLLVGDFKVCVLSGSIRKQSAWPMKRRNTSAGATFRHPTYHQLRPPHSSVSVGWSAKPPIRHHRAANGTRPGAQLRWLVHIMRLLDCIYVDEHAQMLQNPRARRVNEVLRDQRYLVQRLARSGPVATTQGLRAGASAVQDSATPGSVRPLSVAGTTTMGMMLSASILSETKSHHYIDHY